MNLINFDLNLLLAFDALLAERNVTRAGERLCVTQQAMSGSLRRLREHFKDELLVRVGRKLEPTPLALALIEPIQEVLLAIRATLETAPTFNPADARRTVRIAMTDYTSFVILPHLLQHLTKEAPFITCLVEALEHGTFRKIERGNLDFCIAPSNWEIVSEFRPGSEIHSEFLFEDDFVCIYDRDYADIGDTLSIDLYSNLTHNLLSLGAGTESMVETAWRTAGIDGKVAAQAQSFTALLYMLPKTPIVCTGPRRLGSAFASMMGLHVVDCPLKIPNVVEKLSWHKRNTRDPLNWYVRSVLHKIAKTL